MLKNKTINYVLLALILSLFTYFFFSYKYSFADPVFLYLSYFMFAGLSIFGHSMMQSALNKEESHLFINTYLGITAVKMFLVLAVLTIYLFFNKDFLFAVGMLYALAYLLYLAMDVIILLRLLKIKNSQN